MTVNFWWSYNDTYDRRIDAIAISFSGNKNPNVQAKDNGMV